MRLSVSTALAPLVLVPATAAAADRAPGPGTALPGAALALA